MDYSFNGPYEVVHLFFLWATVKADIGHIMNKIYLNMNNVFLTHILLKKEIVPLMLFKRTLSKLNSLTSDIVQLN